MSERKKKLEDIQQQISNCKASLSLSEGKFVTAINKSGSKTDNSTSNTLNTMSPSTIVKPPPTPAKPDEEQDVIKFINNLNKLRDNLEEKNAVMEAQYERNIGMLEGDNKRLNSQVKYLQQNLTAKEGQLVDSKQQNKQLRTNLIELQKSYKQQIHQLNQQLTHYRKQNVQLKAENKSLKADNKIIMGHLDRITKQLKEKQNITITTAEERELRVMKSLYQQTLPNIELKTAQKNIATLQQPKHRLIAQDLSDRNGELKTLIRRLSQQIEILKREKQLLSEQNKQKHLNLQNQKLIVSMMEQQKQKLNSIISKMGEKIMSIQQTNKTLRQTIMKQEEGEDNQESYYRTTRAKAGQFYYRK